MIDKYIAKYLLNTTTIVKKYHKKDIVTLQFFQWDNDVILSGVELIIDFLRSNTKFKKYKIRTLKEGSKIKSKEVAFELEGQYRFFGKYEGIIDGILSRMSSVATNAHQIKKAAGKKEVIFMGDRTDLFLNQTLDGFAAYIGGITSQVTRSQIKYHPGSYVGSMPHALIQIFDGNLIKALEAFANEFPNDPLIALVDFNNDVIKDSIECLKHFGKKLYAVRVDTSKKLSDKYFNNKAKKEFGVNPTLIKALRKELDKNGGKHIKIIVSSGFNAEKIAQFEKEKTPVDIYGVGASVLKIDRFFTGDLVKKNGKNIAKEGRGYLYNKKLVDIN